ncbi:hypothetical protein G6F46_006844 [Rhizopus delemar]|nr:hypothetical protein G6F55_005502 [Rhizopus delemar]KAG1542989.1 hypothetical protein G6F51_006945 [Rhizopus arrhizus]KAG1505023.1 hypothetical protein G6F54_000595 [Rhizopus delemar]KAG1510639.1 hypothetical protein G6F53_006535 [Rhizopus delemar]KAG1526031.1 hypothetical protein G6F52_002799 [Rhizopus delemar]
MIGHLTNKEALIDALFTLYNSSKHQKSEYIQRFIELYEPVCQELNQTKLSIKDFEVINKDVIARGAFGKVTLVKYKEQFYAMKILSKSYLISQTDRSSPIEEKLVLSGTHEWLPKLYASFQDEKYLYLVMEYAPGGDLQGLMERRQGRFTEQEAKFYIAELILAVESVHQLGYMHRDIKPGNILIDLYGHIKLGDLGSCIAIHTKHPLLMVGTMSYVSPEMCNSEGSDPAQGPAYGPESDWWSVGIVLYELLFGVPPFTGKDIQIQMKLLDPNPNISFGTCSPEAKDLLSKLLHKSNQHRLGHHGASEIKSHSFFKDIQWDTLHTSYNPPFIPAISSLDDLTFFSATPENDEDDEEDEEENLEDKDFPFIGYTFTENLQPTERKYQESEELQSTIASLKEQLEKEKELNKKNMDALKQLEREKRNWQLDLQTHNVKLKKEEEKRLEELLEKEREQWQSNIYALKEENKQLILRHEEQLEKERQSWESRLQTQQTNISKEEKRHKEQLEKEEKNWLINIDSLNEEKEQLIAKHKEELKEYIEQVEKCKAQITLLEEQQLKIMEQQQEKYNKLESENKRLEFEMKKTVERYKRQLEVLKTEQSQKTTLQSDVGKQSKIMSVMWQKDRDNLRTVQQALETSESRLALTKREIARLKKEIKSYQKSSFEQQMKDDKLERRMTENQDAINLVYNLIDNSKGGALNNRRRKRVDVSVNLSSSLSSLGSKELNKLRAHSVDDSNQLIKNTQNKIRVEKEFIASTQRTMAARSKLSRTKTEFDQELQKSIDRSNSKISLLQQKLQQYELNNNKK